MDINTFNELKKKSYNKKVFLVMENGEQVIIEDLKDMPFLNTTLGIHLKGMDVFYKEQIKELQDKIDKQDKIIKELTSAIKTLNNKEV